MQEEPKNIYKGLSSAVKHEDKVAQIEKKPKVHGLFLVWLGIMDAGSRGAVGGCSKP